MTAFLIGFVSGLAAALALAWAIGAARLGTFLLAFSDGLEAVRRPVRDATEIRAQVVADLVSQGYSVGEANEAVAASASGGPRRVSAWRRRALAR